MEFAAPVWLFPLVAVPGLALAALLGAGASASRRRSVSALAFAAAWLLLALLIVSPRVLIRSETWHEPVVMLVADESASHRILGARDSARASMEAARRHYEAAGFRVVEAAVDAPSLGTGLGALLDTAAPPNLRAVLFWTDGRFPDSAEAPVAWPAPVHPVVVYAGVGEVQGESAAFDAAAPGVPALEVSWRSSGSGGAVLELRDSAGALLHRAALPSSEAGAPIGARRTARVEIPASVAAALATASAPGLPVVLIRPAGSSQNITAKNDTVRLVVHGTGGPRHLFARPLVSLEERALLDALRGNGARVAAFDAGSPPPARGDVVWVRADAPASVASGARTFAAAAGVPVVSYRIAFPAPDGASMRGGATRVPGPDARLGWAPEGNGFLPVTALRLADALGAEPVSWTSPRVARSAVRITLAWAEETGRRVPLAWRDADDADGGGAYGVIVPALWGTDDPSAVAWMRGLAAWIAARDVPRVVLPDPATAGRGFTVRAATGAAESVADPDAPGPAPVLELRGPSGAVVRVPSEEDGSGRFRHRVPPLVAGRYAVWWKKGVRDDAVAWSGAMTVRDPRDRELGRLLPDREGLARFATRQGTAPLFTDAPDGALSESSVWPALPGGQIREARTRAIALAPPLPVAIAITALLVVSWVARRRA